MVGVEGTCYRLGLDGADREVKILTGLFFYCWLFHLQLARYLEFGVGLEGIVALHAHLLLCASEATNFRDSVIAIGLTGKAIIERVVEEVGLILLRVILLVAPVISCPVLRHLLRIIVAEAITESRVTLWVLVKLMHKIAAPSLMVASRLIFG